jgi:hypothetical protein
VGLRAGFADEAECFARVNRERNAVDDRLLHGSESRAAWIGLRNRAHFDERHGMMLHGETI